MLGVICRVESIVNANMRHRLFQTHVMPRLQYCPLILGNRCEVKKNKLDNVLKSALCVITSNCSVNFSKSIHAAYSVLLLGLLLNWRNVCLLFKIMHGGDELRPAGPCSITALSGHCTLGSISNKLRFIETKSANKLCFIVCGIKQ